jgi:hypothetical protein
VTQARFLRQKALKYCEKRTSGVSNGQALFILALEVTVATLISRGKVKLITVNNSY